MLSLRLRHIVRLMLLAIIVSTLSACHEQDRNGSDNEMIGNVALRIALGMPDGATHRVSPRRTPARRVATPEGGEHGNGLEAGQHHENDIHSVSIYAYSGYINGDASTAVKLVAHITGLDLTTDNAEVENGMLVHTIRVDNQFINGYTFSPADKFIVATNLTNIGATTLGELRNAYVTEPVQKVAAGEAKNGCNDFVMSNEKESSYTDGDGSPGNPHLIKVTIERVTARVDFVTTGSNIDVVKQSLRYAATDGVGDTKVGDVYVSHIRVFNAMQAPSYLIKRLAESESHTYFYLADEDKPANKVVVEPHTWQKSTRDVGVLNDWYGESHVLNVQNTGDSWFREADRVHLVGPDGIHDGFDTGVSIDEQGYTYYVVDYVNENTMLPHNTNSYVTTGVLLKAVYMPEQVVVLDGEGLPVEDDGYVYGQTFWRYRPIEQTFDETKVLYFSNEADAQSYKAAHAETQAEITAYTNARCYYPVYLRHDNTRNTPEIDMMSFGIVRNNIYRLKVGFSGPGYPTLDPVVEVDPEGIRPYIFVRKWYKIIHPEIEL